MKSLSLNKYAYFLIAVTILIAAIVVYMQQTMGKIERASQENHSGMNDKPQNSEKDTNNQNHSDHHQMVLENGEKAMGFSQRKTTHHFLLMKDGGAIQVEANDTQDLENRDKVRKHLAVIAQQFKNGIFTTPFAVHGQVPPGVPAMDQLKDTINYSYEETEKGARVRIETDNPQALAAIHQFLRFQIEDHQTGDPLNVEN